jgi:hypothetical protein
VSGRCVCQDVFEDIVCQDTDQPVNAEWRYDSCLLCPLLEIHFKGNLQSFTVCMCVRASGGGGHSNTYMATKLYRVTNSFLKRKVIVSIWFNINN